MNEGRSSLRNLLYKRKRFATVQHKIVKLVVVSYHASGFIDTNNQIIKHMLLGNNFSVDKSCMKYMFFHVHNLILEN